MRSNRLYQHRSVIRNYRSFATRHGAFGLMLVLTIAGTAGSALAQPPQQGSLLPNPRIFTLSPSGGKVGSTFEMSVSGPDTEEAISLLFSMPNIKGDLIPATEPPAPPADPKNPEQPRRRRQLAQPVVTNKFKVTIPPGTPVGIHDVRLVNKFGVSNPRAFVVGDLSDIIEKEPNNDVPEAQRIEMNTTVNGAIAAPTDVDFFVFGGKKGQRVLVSCLASSIDSRLQAGLELYDANGRALAQNRNYSGTDALLDQTLPADGDYFIRLFEFTHLQGSPEHFYRLSITTAPWIDAIFPPMVEPGKPATLTIFGRNLPGGKLDPSVTEEGRPLETLTVTVDVSKDPAALQRLNFSGHLPPSSSSLDGFEYRVKNEAGSSNPFLLVYAKAPVILDNGNNETPETAQEVTVPCEIAGRVEKRRDRDWYTFSAKKGEVYSIEVCSERLGAPTDMMFLVRNAENKQDIGEFDDEPDTLTLQKFFTRTTDPARMRFEVKADGKYQLLVKGQDAEFRAGPRQFYRVRITPEQPDFRLIVLPPDDTRPDSCRLMRGSNQYFTVLAWRLDGFDGPIALSAEGLPTGISCPTQTIGSGYRQTALVVSAPKDAKPGVFEFKVKGTATINGQPVVREARSASITWPLQQPQPNIPTISRLDHNIMVAVNDQAPFDLTTAVSQISIAQGDKPNVTLKLTRIWPDLKVPLQVASADVPNARNQPPGITINNNQPITIPADKNEVVVALEVKSAVALGTYNFVLRATGQIPFNKDPMATQKPAISMVLPSTPLTITVVPKTVAAVTATAPGMPPKPGTQSEITVKVARQHNYAGAFKVQLILPPTMKGLAADDVMIPAGKDEVKLLVRVAPDAAVGNRPDLIVRAIAIYDNKIPTTQETKVALNIVK